MIGFLRGVAGQLILPNSLILDVNGVGYLVHCPTDLISRTIVGNELSLFVITSVREDAITLYGFERSEDKDWFEALRSAQGVGPSLALGILSSLSRSELAHAISTKDQAALTRISGVGAKTASRLIVELQSRLPQLDVGHQSLPGPPEIGGDNVMGDLRLALTSLGYGIDQIRTVLERVPSELSLEEMLRYCLKELSV